VNFSQIFANFPKISTIPELNQIKLKKTWKKIIQRFNGLLCWQNRKNQGDVQAYLIEQSLSVGPLKNQPSIKFPFAVIDLGQ
jgi:hypothetical protein